MSSTAKKIFKILIPVEGKDGKTHWIRVGTAFPNRDDSINLYIDAYPAMGNKLQLRELDEEDLRRRDGDASRGRGELRAVAGGAAADRDLPF
jgi:hypothetical protein